MRKSIAIAEMVTEAHGRIAAHVRRTFLEHSRFFSELTGANVYFKCENLQHTGSFKLRGAMNKLLSLDPVQARKGVVAASTGNHGKAVGYAADKLGIESIVFVPSNADRSKVASIRQFGTTVRFAGNDCIEAESAAKQFALDNQSVYISPYNDPMVAAGQGVIGLELCDQLNQMDAVFVSLGGGGLMSGVGAFVKSVFPDCKMIGCSPENSKVMIESLRAGKILDLPSTETLSDGTAGGVEQDSITFELCQELVDQSVTVSENNIQDSLVQFIGVHNQLIEGAAAVAIASLIKSADSWQNRNVVVVLCGANIGTKKLQRVMAETEATAKHRQ